MEKRKRADRCAVCGEWDAGCTSTHGARAQGDKGICMTWVNTGWSDVAAVTRMRRVR